jgi:ubiquinone biosynthesis protein COQ9
MIRAPERNPGRDAAIRAMLPHVPLDGWTMRALSAGLGALGEPLEAGFDLFPDGPIGMFEAWCDLADREMEAAASGPDGIPENLGLAARVRALVALRLRQLKPHREALKRGLALLAGAGRLPAAARIMARTVDSIWAAAGERATDFSWYTKRASLAAIYAATLLYWLADESEEGDATLAFFDRRLAELATIGRLRGAFAEGIRARLASPPCRLLCS